MALPLQWPKEPVTLKNSSKPELSKTKLSRLNIHTFFLGINDVMFGWALYQTGGDKSFTSKQPPPLL